MVSARPSPRSSPPEQATEPVKTKVNARVALGICIAVAGAAMVGGWFLGTGISPLLLAPAVGLIAVTEGLRQTILGLHGSRSRHSCTGAGSPGRALDDDPVVPADAQPGWIYEDTSGRHAMVVRTADGYRCIGLPDFVLLSPGHARQLRTVSGRAEVTVLPLATDA